MNIFINNHLLHTTLTINHQGKTETIERLVIDTGAAHSLISSDAVFELGIYATNSEIITMYGIGGEDHAFRKVVDKISFGTYSSETVSLDFGFFDPSYGINGIIGLDILLPGKFVIDLDSMVVYQK